MSEPAYSAEEVACLLFVPVPTVRRWLESGRLPALRDPATGEQRVRRDALAKFLADNDMPPLDHYEQNRVGAFLAQIPRAGLRERMARLIMRYLQGEADD
jgi:excisionase family DNA binding protein